MVVHWALSSPSMTLMLITWRTKTISIVILIMIMMFHRFQVPVSQTKTILENISMTRYRQSRKCWEGLFSTMMLQITSQSPIIPITHNIILFTNILMQVYKKFSQECAHLCLIYSFKSHFSFRPITLVLV